MSSVNLKQLEKHQDYYLKGGDLYIVVAHTLFRIHSYFFHRESQRFRDIMSTLAPATQVRQGETDHTAIMVKDVSVEHFSKFLWVFYNPIYSVYTATLAEWIAILKLADEYQFLEVKRLAIRELDQFDMPIAERIELYHRHAVDLCHLVPLYVKLCIRDEGPTDEETSIMGMKTSLIIFRARERLRFQPLSKVKPVPVVDESHITRTIYSLLGFDGQTGSVPPRRAITRMRRVTLRQSSDSTSPEASACGDQVQNMVTPENENEKILADTDENAIDAEEDCGEMEFSQKGLMVVAKATRREVSRSHFTLVSTHGGTTSGAIAIFMVVPARTFLLLFALSWTFLLFILIRSFPSHLRIL